MFNSSKLILSTRPFTGFNVNNPKLNIEYFNRFQDSQQIKSVIGQAANHNIQAIMTLGEAELMPHLVEAYKQRGTTIYPIIPNMSSYVREVCDYGIVGAGIHRLKRLGLVNLIRMGRSEERRVGKSVDLGGRRIIKKTTNVAGVTTD